MSKLVLVLLVIFLLVAGFVLFGFYNSYQSRNLNMNHDKTFISHNLDGLITVEVPASFKIDEKELLETYHGSWGLQPNTRSFTYYFTRGAYTNVGGITEEPVILGVQVFASSTDIQEITSSPASDGVAVLVYPFRTFSYTQGEQENLTTPQGSMVRVRADSGDNARTLVFYTNKKEHYRVILSYENGYLTDEAALTLMEQVIPSIHMQSDLMSRIQSITEAFYKENPDKRPK